MKHNKLGKAAALAVTATLAFSTHVSADEFTIERLVGSPSLSGPSVQGLELSPNGKRVTFLRGKEENQAQLDLWEFDTTTGEARLLVDSNDLLGGSEEVLSEEEKARRERNRSLTGKSGIVSYFWSNDSTTLLFPLGGDVYVLPLGGEVKRLTETAAYETDIKFSPKGTYVSFIRDRELYTVDIATGLEKKLTTGSSDTVANGMAEFIAQEELGRYTGYWWSPDETKIAYEQFDETDVIVKDRYEVQPDGGVVTLKQRYPEAGSTNVTVKLGVVDLESGTSNWMPLGDEKDIYLGRVDWTADSEHVVYQRLNRAQTRLDMIFADMSGEAETKLSETSDVWINLHNNLNFLSDGTFLWAHERTGYRHLYLFDRSGKQLRALTSGEWVVYQIEGVDEENRTVYFTGHKDSPIEQHLYKVSLDGGEITKISQEAGWHKVNVGDGIYVDKFSSPTQPPQIMIRSLADGSLISTVLENKLDDSHVFAPYNDGSVKQEFGTIEAADGSALYYRLYRPAVLEDGKKYPAIMAPYGGPHGQRAKREWKVDFNEYLARNGYVVMVLDNRGMWNRGLKFESHIKNAMGSVEIDDQVTGVNYLKTLDYIDGDNVGMWGWSYGGYMTLMALFKEPDVFKAGVSVAPVTDWRLYDTGYTERYLGHPDAPGDVYNRSSVFPYVDNFSGKLLLIHGMADDNVFFDNSVKLMATLQDKNKPFELMTYPGKKHGIRGQVQAHLYEAAFSFFERTLK